ncbi:MAG: YggT family protein [Halanaerobiaceae bacterium]
MVRLLISVVDVFFTIISWLIIFRVIISWIRPNFGDPRWRKILTFIYNVTEPILGPIRRLIPTGSIGIDISPFIAYIALMILRRFIIRILYGLMF